MLNSSTVHDLFPSLGKKMNQTTKRVFPYTLITALTELLCLSHFLYHQFSHKNVSCTWSPSHLSPLVAWCHLTTVLQLLPLGSPATFLPWNALLFSLSSCSWTLCCTYRPFLCWHFVIPQLTWPYTCLQFSLKQHFVSMGAQPPASSWHHHLPWAELQS